MGNNLSIICSDVSITLAQSYSMLLMILPYKLEKGICELIGGGGNGHEGFIYSADMILLILGFLWSKHKI